MKPLYICAQCGCPDLESAKEGGELLALGEAQVRCPSCGWEGPMKETRALLTTEKVYDSEAVLNCLMHVAFKHAAAPIAFTLRDIGMISDHPDDLNAVMRAAMEGLVRESFLAAAILSKHEVTTPEVNDGHDQG